MKRVFGVNDCFADSVAYVLNLHTARVPFFIDRADYWLTRGFKSWLARRGKRFRTGYLPESMVPLRGLVIVVGLSPRSKAKRGSIKDMRQLHHAVVYRNGKPAHDPTPGRKFIKGKPLWWIVICKRTSKSAPRR